MGKPIMLFFDIPQRQKILIILNIIAIIAILIIISLKLLEIEAIRVTVIVFPAAVSFYLLCNDELTDLDRDKVFFIWLFIGIIHFIFYLLFDLPSFRTLLFFILSYSVLNYIKNDEYEDCLLNTYFQTSRKHRETGKDLTGFDTFANLLLGAVIFFSTLGFLIGYENKNKNDKTEIEKPEFIASHFYYNGVTNLNNNDYENALYNFNKAISYDSTKSEYYHNRGVAIEKLYNDTLKALDDFRKAVKLEPHNAKAHFNIGRILFKQENYREAAEFFKISIALDPNYYPSYYSCAFAQYNIKDYDEALINFEKAIQYDKNQTLYSSYYYFIGLIYKETEKPNMAKSNFEKAADLGNEDAKKELEVLNNLILN